MACRAALARAVVAADKRVLVISHVAEGHSHLIRVPVAVLRLHSAMINDMATDGVFDSPPEEAGAAHKIDGNPRHHPAAVSAALRWAMGLHSMLASDVQTCMQVFMCEPPPGIAQILAMLEPACPLAEEATLWTDREGLPEALPLHAIALCT
jgi:hypothetical protein